MVLVGVVLQLQCKIEELESVHWRKDLLERQLNYTKASTQLFQRKIIVTSRVQRIYTVTKL